MKEKKDYSTKLILDYLNSNYTAIGKFCKNRGVDRKAFEESLNLLQECAPNIYNEYEKRVEDKEKKEMVVQKREIQKIIDYIKNGIEVDGYKARRFEYLDFCLVCDLSIREFYDLCDKYHLITIDNMKSIRVFIETNLVNKKINKKKVLGEKYFIIIDGEEKEVTELEKLQILSLMKDLRLPMEEKVYKQLCRRYFRGEFREFDIDYLKVDVRK